LFVFWLCLLIMRFYVIFLIPVDISSLCSKFIWIRYCDCEWTSLINLSICYVVIVMFSFHYFFYVLTMIAWCLFLMWNILLMWLWLVMKFSNYIIFNYRIIISGEVIWGLVIKWLLRWYIWGCCYYLYI